MIITVQIDTKSPAIVQHREIEVAAILRSIAEDIEDGETGTNHLTDSRGHHVGHWKSDPLDKLRLTGEKLVSAYISWLDNMWSTNPAHIREGYARHGRAVTNASNYHAAVINDTDESSPSQWAFREDFISHLRAEGLYCAQTAAELSPNATQRR